MACVLVVDDNEESRALMRYLLRCSGHDVLTAGNGADGLAAARRQVPDAVVVDLQMPVMDGFTLLAEMRKDPALGSIPALGVAAVTTQGQQEQALAAGFGGYLGKPIDPLGFVDALDGLLT
jgi:two-component system cell cycle response regulator